MGDKLKQEMMSYYDERAQEYDEIYLGKGPASILDSTIYINEETKIGRIVSTFGRGHLIDVGCGTGFWLPYYARNCSRVTLIDQSKNMLSECKRRTENLGLKDKCCFAQGDFFELAFRKCIFDSAIVGFLISHLSLEREQSFFAKLKKILKPNAPLMIIDSAWSKKRRQYREKEGIQERHLNDGRIFTIYKRYFDNSDIEEMFKRHLLKLESSYIGDVFLAVIGENDR